MALSSGTRLGPYEILAAAGAGGMGEVYRARDTRLDRTVAVKVLHSELMATADLRARFEREAKVISQLSHPNICVLYDIGNDNGTDFLVMEFLDGESLAERLKRDPLPTAELLKIAIEVADGLQKAHRAGIVHRDLKPGNVMLTKAGARLLDFGLAKPAASSASAAAAQSGYASVMKSALTQTSPAPSGSPLSAAGSVVGTVQYMSPEQIQGMEADARSDIFAFGVMLFEMATGKRAFEGKTQASIVGQILAVDPPAASAIRGEVPAALDRVIRICLEKDPDERIQSAHDLKLQLQAAADTVAARAPAAVQKKSHPSFLLAGCVVLLLAAISAAALLWIPQQPPLSVEAYILPPDKNGVATSFTLANDDASGTVVLSPDGKQIAFVASSATGNQIYVRSLDNKNATPIPGTENATYPFWSPDEKSLGFYSSGKLRRVDLAGGPVLDICAAARFRGASWSQDFILFAPDVTSAIFRVPPVAGSTPVQVTTVAANQTTHRWPLVLPDGKHFLYLASNHSDPGASANNGIYLASVDGKENRFLFSAESNVAYARGQLIWEQSGSLLARSFDPSSGKLGVETVPLAGGVGFNGSTWRAAFDANANGVLVYQPGLAATRSKLILYTPDGKSTELPDSVGMMDVRISPDGRKIAALTRSNHEVWILDIAEGTRVRFTFGATADGLAWSADSKYLYFASLAKSSRIVRKAVDGSGQETTILQNPEPVHVSDVSRDGTMLLLEKRSGAIPSTTWVLPLVPGAKPHLLTDDPVATHFARFSPDGKQVVYVTTETGRNELYLMSIAGGGKQQLTNGGGWQSRWGANGKTIYYTNGEGVTVALPLLRNGDAIEPGKALPLFTSNTLLPTSFYSSSWDATPDGRRFLVNVSGERSDETRAVLITNWPARLKK